MESRDHDRLHSELVTLLEKQIETLEKETFVELTEKDVSEFEDRYRRIRELQGELLPSQAA
jgi:hypothetical protein